MTRTPAGPQTLLRSLNARAILESLARRGPLTRAELMSETGLSRTAVTQVLRMLESGDAVTSAGVDRETRGPAAGLVSLNPSLGCAAAAHIDHRSASIAILDPTGRILAERSGAFDTAGRLSDRVEDLLERLSEALTPAMGPLRVVVVGVPGIVSRDGAIRDDQGPDGAAFRSALQARLGCAVRIENDVNLAALAELDGTVATDLASFALVTIDDGLGAGIVIEGTLHRGASGIAGEVMYLPQPGLPVGVPVINEVVVADLALANGRDPKAPLRAHLDAAIDGDAGALEMLAELARRLVLVTGSITLVLDPSAYILAGDAAHPAFVEAVREAADAMAHLLPMRFLVSSFGREATLIGAVGEAADVLRETVFTGILTSGDRTPQ